MCCNRIVFLILLSVKHAFGSPNETIIATHICDDAPLIEIKHQVELLRYANENKGLRLEINMQCLDRRLTETSNEIKRITELLSEINRKIPAENSANQRELLSSGLEILRLRLQSLDERLTERSNEKPKY